MISMLEFFLKITDQNLSALVENITEATTFLLTSNPPFKHLTFKDTNMNTKEDENETNVDETLTTTTDKMKRTYMYFYVKKTECVSILV